MNGMNGISKNWGKSSETNVILLINLVQDPSPNHPNLINPIKNSASVIWEFR
jgi:hypothetical protein